MSKQILSGPSPKPKSSGETGRPEPRGVECRERGAGRRGPRGQALTPVSPADPCEAVPFGVTVGRVAKQPRALWGKFAADVNTRGERVGPQKLCQLTLVVAFFFSGGDIRCSSHLTLEQPCEADLGPTARLSRPLA